MRKTQIPTPQPAGRAALVPLKVVIVVIAAVSIVGLAFVGAIGFLMYRTIGSMGRLPVDVSQMNLGSNWYRTLPESLPASHAAAKELVKLSHEAVVTVSECQLDKDPSPDFKGYLDFGYKYASSQGFDIGFASNHKSESGSFSTGIAPNHLYFADFSRLKAGQRVVFEEIPTNNLPTAKLTQYSADPYLFVRPVAVR